MAYKIIQLDKQKYKQWDDFCNNCNQAWFWHTTDWLEYILARTEFSPENLSFFVYQGDVLEAIVPLVAEKINNHRELSYEGGPVPAPAVKDNLSDHGKSELIKLIFRTIDKLADENKVSRSSFSYSPLTKDSLQKKNNPNLIDMGFNNISLATRLIDLKKDEQILWKELRRNHRRNIEKGRQFQVNIYDSEKITEQIFNNYTKLHARAAGRQTRPQKTFQLMLEWIKAGLAFLVAVEYQGAQIGFEYYSLYKNQVYGFSAANDPDYESQYPIRHILEWQSILYMKTRRFDFYEIGLQQNEILPYDFPDQKQLNISHFKKGFGGFELPFLIFEKYYSQEYLSKIKAEQKSKFDQRKKQYG